MMAGWGWAGSPESRACIGSPPRRRYAVPSEQEEHMSEVIHAPETGTGEQDEPTRIDHWIAGRREPGTSDRTGPVYNPSTGRQTGVVHFATVEEIDRAVGAARDAFPAWRALSLAKRAELMFAVRELVHDRREDIARILTLE